MATALAKYKEVKAELQSPPAKKTKKEAESDEATVKVGITCDILYNKVSRWKLSRSPWKLKPR